MSFVSPVFFLFFSAVLLLDRLVPGKYRWAVLLLASYFFYAYYNLWLLGLVFLTTLVSYLCALRIEAAQTKGRRRLALALDMAVCLGVLFVFKYLDFALEGVFALGRLLGAEADFTGFHLLLPMGISFYVFQTLSYTLDVYRGAIPAERHLGFYALFVAFFPQLVAGPIERPGALLPQLKRPRSLRPGDVSEGLRLLLRGYAKKVLISDYLARFVDAAYGSPATAGGAALLIATVFFAVQIYCDFSGYSDIALGCARLMGIRLSENFRRLHPGLLAAVAYQPDSLVYRLPLHPSRRRPQRAFQAMRQYSPRLSGQRAVARSQSYLSRLGRASRRLSRGGNPAASRPGVFLAPRQGHSPDNYPAAGLLCLDLLPGRHPLRRSAHCAVRLYRLSGFPSPGGPRRQRRGAAPGMSHGGAAAYAGKAPCPAGGGRRPPGGPRPVLRRAALLPPYNRDFLLPLPGAFPARRDILHLFSVLTGAHDETP